MATAASTYCSLVVVLVIDVVVAVVAVVVVVGVVLTVTAVARIRTRRWRQQQQQWQQRLRSGSRTQTQSGRIERFDAVGRTHTHTHTRRACGQCFKFSRARSAAVVVVVVDSCEPQTATMGMIAARAGGQPARYMHDARANNIKPPRCTTTKVCVCDAIHIVVSCLSLLLSRGCIAH